MGPPLNFIFVLFCYPKLHKTKPKFKKIEKIAKIYEKKRNCNNENKIHLLLIYINYYYLLLICINYYIYC